MPTIGIAMTLENMGLSQIRNHDFDSMFRVGNTCFAVGEDGIFTLCGADDDGVKIDAYFDTRLIDFETMTKIRSVYFGYEAEGELQVSFIADENHEHTAFLPRVKMGPVSQSGRLRGRRDQLGRYYKFRVQNESGEDFSLDMIEVVPVLLPKKPRRP
jgi:hypothetical protein